MWAGPGSIFNRLTGIRSYQSSSTGILCTGEYKVTDDHGRDYGRREYSGEFDALSFYWFGWNRFGNFSRSLGKCPLALAGFERIRVTSTGELEASWWNVGCQSRDGCGTLWSEGNDGNLVGRRILDKTYRHEFAHFSGSDCILTGGHQIEGYQCG